MEFSVILCTGAWLTIDPHEKSHILSCLQDHRRIEGEGEVAQILDLHLNTLRSGMKKLGLNRSMN